MNYNQFTILLLGNLNAETSAERLAFIQLFGQLWLTSVFHMTERVTEAGAIAFHFVNPYDWDLPTNITGVVHYSRVLNNRQANNKLTTIENATVTKGDFVAALSTASLDADLNYIQSIDISDITTVADTKIWIGVSNATLTDAYTPFSTALNAAYFDRAQSQAVSRGVQQGVIANNVQKALPPNANW